jgi:predicted AAA+ superfamily ATPase
VDEDRPRVRGRFILTGSANLLLLKQVSESLAGRASYVSLWPMTRHEQRGVATTGIWDELWQAPVADWYDVVRASGGPEEDWRALALRGGYPVPALELNAAERSLWYQGYVQTYLERDLQQLSGIDSLADFRRLMQVAALRLGGVINQADLARDADLSRPTAHRYLNLWKSPSS